jgi:hypothetical protein
VAKAILSGRRLVRAIQQHFTEGSIGPVDHLACEATNLLDVTEIHGVSLSERGRPPASDLYAVGERTWIFPKESPGFDEPTAKKEAARCLQCGLICYRREDAAHA